MENSILEQAKVAKQNYMLQFPKKHTLNIKLGPEIVCQVFASKFIWDWVALW